MIRPQSLFFALILPVGLPVAGQQATPPPPTSPVGAYVTPTLVLTRLDGSSGVLVGGGAGLVLGSSITLGGRGYALTGKVRSSGDTGTASELGFGYGGVAVDYVRRRSPRLSIGATLLVGAGRAELSNREIGIEVANENFMVIEPGLVARLSGPAILSTWLGLSYRAVLSVQDLPGVGAAGLRGASLSLGLRFTDLP